MPQSKIKTNIKNNKEIKNVISNEPVGTSHEREYITVTEAMEMMRLLWHNEYETLGDIFPGTVPGPDGYKCFFVTSMLVVPNQMRPIMSFNGKK